MYANDKVIRAINFDLDTKKLQIYYSPINWQNAYRDIEKFMNKHGFNHRQGSGYVSEKPMNRHDIQLLIREIMYEHPWISKCKKNIDVTVVTELYSLNPYMDKIERMISKKYDYSIPFIEQKANIRDLTIKPKRTKGRTR